MAGPKHKQPTFNQSLVRDGKQPRATEGGEDVREPRRGVEDPSALKSRPSWQFHLMDMVGHGKDGTWACSACGGAELHKIRERLASFESMTWVQIMLKTKSHSIPVSSVCGDARKRLEDLKLDDVEYIFSFRIGKKERLWGIRFGALFLILWWDPEHTVYPMNITDN